MHALMKLGFVATLALPAMTPAVAIVPLFGGVQVSVSVTDYNDGYTDAQSNTASLAGVPASLAAATAALVIDNNGGSITAQGEAYGDWTSATAGTFAARNFGWQYSNGGRGQAVIAGGTNWYYQFTTPTAAVLTWTYDVRGYYNYFGLWGFQLYVDGVAVGATTDPYNPASSGTLTANLAGGQTHDLALVNSGNLEGGGDIFGFMDGDFTWSIASAGRPV